MSVLTNDEQQIYLDERIKQKQSEINTFNRLKRRLQKVIDSPNAIIVYAYDSNHPEVIFVGDRVMTKYGDEGIVTNVEENEYDGYFTLDLGNGEYETFGGSRLSFIMQFVREDKEV